MFQFFFPDAALVLFFLAAPGKLHHRVSCKIFNPARHTATAPGARQFLRANLKVFAAVRRRFAKKCLRYTFSAARILALRDRGFRSISSSLAVSGFFVNSRHQPCFAPSRSASLTILSSSE